MALVGEALLSAAVEVLLDRIVSHDLFRSKKPDTSLLEKLRITLLSVEALLNDAEEKQFTNPPVKKWLHALKQAFFDAEDLLDQINTEALRCKLEANSPTQSTTHQVLNFLSSPFNKFQKVINSKIQDLFQRLEHLALQKDILQLKEGVSSSVWHGTPTSSVVDESTISGRDGDRKELKKYLMSEDAGGSKIGVVSIVGMGGLGKTTLAKLLYNDLDVQEKFDLKAWAYISKDFDVCRVTKTILESVTYKSIDTDNLNIFQEKLKESLSHKRFLIVLDDIWDGSYVDWNNLMDIFRAGEMGSKIIITTRDKSVAKAMQTYLPIYRLTPLPSDDCWSLLSKHAFGANNCSKQSNLELIGKEISKQCDGLPLAAVALGGLLRTNLSENYWNKVLKSNVWDLPNVKVLPALLLSYHYLPAPLKRCFTYLSIFPKNYRLEKDMVVRLWIAEGLVCQSKSDKTIEEIGDEYFDELVSRSLIHRGSRSGQAIFEMHDLINDLATMISSSYCLRHAHITELPDSLGNLIYLRYLDLSRTKIQKLPDATYKLYNMQTLLLSNCRLLTKLPEDIGNLIYLRYLDLSYTKIQRLPDATCKLYNMQTLLLSYCQLLTELPEDIGNLVNLQHLNIRGTNLKKMPIQIATLQNLHTLSDFVISKTPDGLTVRELKNFSRLRGQLSILKLQNVTDPSEAAQANLKKKDQIDSLALEWDCGMTENTQIERLVLEQLQPPINLKELSIRFYGGSSFPNWLGDSSFGNMVSLCIMHCYYCWSLPPLGRLVSLKRLYICGMKSVKTVGTEFYGSNSTSFQPFPSLETLSFRRMPEWEEWNLIGGTTIEFPRLSKLFLNDCPKLKGTLPNNLPSISFELSDCPLLVPMVSSLRDGLPTTLQSLTLHDCEKLEFLPHDSLHNYTSLKNLEMHRSCYSLTSFTLGCLPVLENLEISGCKNLKSISFAENASQSLSLLRHLVIEDCPELDSLPEGGLPTPNLIDLMVSNCEIYNLCDIKSLDGKWLQHLTSLKELHIENAQQLESLPEEGLPSSLSKFTIWTCPLLEASCVKGEKEWPKISHIPYITINGETNT
uniref:Disease resistance RPP13-like protein 1 n=1 Tax=Cajanus cajan TaxID=3821 RepID=A0A151RHI4_CAJCA|nr:Putative disease resistance RPP13-like protein 1 [Cajanus cajan]